jgi:hypothetical protein
VPIEEEPIRDFESVLEFLDKIIDDPIKDLNNENDLNNFRINHGEVNFVIAIDNKDDENLKEKNGLFSCVKNLAKEKYLTQYYFGLIDKKNYKLEQNYNDDDDIVDDNKNKDILSVKK